MLYIVEENDYIPLTYYQDVEIIEQVSGNLTLSFTTFNHGENAYDKVVEEKTIFVGEHEFVIKQIEENGIVKKVSAVSEFFSLHGKFTENIYGGTKLISDFAKWMMMNTGWTYDLQITSEEDRYVFIPNFGYSNRLKLIQDFCQVTGLEYKIMPNKHIIFNKDVGVDNNAQYRYGYNVKTIDRTVDTTNLATRIRGFITTEETEGVHDDYYEYLSPNHKIFGIIDAEPIRDAKFDTEKEFKEYLVSQLQDEPEIAITVDTIELNEKALGEHVWLIYEPLGITMRTRILEKVTTIKGNKLVTSRVVIGNATSVTDSDMYAKQQVEIDKNKQQTISYFEQTNERIYMAVVEWDGNLAANKAEWEMTASQIRSEVWGIEKDLDGKITDANSRITQTAKEIRAEVSEVERRGDEKISENTSLISQTAREIRSEVSEINYNLKEGIQQSNSKIEQTAREIRSEVNTVETDLKQGLKETNSRITQSSEGIIAEVEKKITSLDGRVTASNSKIEQTASSLTSEISTVDRNAKRGITEANSSIRQLDREITMAVSAVEDVEGELKDQTAEINLLRNEVSLKVSENQVQGMISVGVRDGISVATIQANQINFQGAVFGSTAKFTGSLETPVIKGGNNEIYFGSTNSSYRIDYQGGGLRFKGATNTYIQATSSIINFYTSQFNSGSTAIMRVGAAVEINSNLSVTGTINGQSYTSKRELKKNIEPMKDNALSKVINSPVYKYNYIDDLDGEQKYTGLIIDEAPVDVVNMDGNTINIYSMTSVLWKAVQEQQEQIAQLQQQLKDGN